MPVTVIRKTLKPVAYEYFHEALVPHLSDMQLKVLYKMLEGKTTLQIATSLGIATKTTATHRDRVLEKLVCSTTEELWVHMYDLKLIGWFECAANP